MEATILNRLRPPAGRRGPFRKNGWLKFRLSEIDALDAIVGFILGRVPECRGDLRHYHDAVASERHEVLHRSLSEALRASDLPLRLARENRGTLTRLAGGAFAMQADPYLRIARPSRYDDNIGLHRDADYGQTEDEITVHVALTPTDENGCMRLLSGSHRTVERPIQSRRPQTGKGDLGIPDEMLIYPPDFIERMVAVPLALGDAVAFNPRTIHGQVVNRMKTTRFAMDFRIIRAELPQAQRDGGKWYRAVGV